MLNRISLQFKKISEAYQVLSDPELRRKYNEYGAKSNEIQPEGGFGTSHVVIICIGNESKSIKYVMGHISLD